MTQNTPEMAHKLDSATDRSALDETACDALSPINKWYCTRGVHEDPVHIAGEGSRSTVFAIWTDEALIAEKVPSEDTWEGGSW